MDQSSFDMVLSDDLGRGGVGLNEAVSRLLALSELYSAVISSKTSPGNQRVRLPVWAEAIQPTVSEASPTQSLKVAIELPSDLDDDDYEKSELPRACNRDFIDTVGAVVDEDDSKIVQLYPEKADRLRILQKISDLSGGQDGRPLLIYKLGGRSTIRLGPEQAQWAKSLYPSTTPEPKTVRGMVVAGKLHGDKMFEIDDGFKRVSVEAKPADGSNINPLEMLTQSLGKVVEIKGTAFYKKNGYLKSVSDISSVHDFAYSTDLIEGKLRKYSLAKDIVFSVDADIDQRDFLVANEELVV